MGNIQQILYRFVVVISVLAILVIVGKANVDSIFEQQNEATVIDFDPLK